VVISPDLNWERNRGSVDQKSRMSGMEKSGMHMRSSPRPNAHAISSLRSVRGI
jgi:hypothetical protein